ncbi:hypothetical protein F0562_002881 [Nyssa sinensis]|uniref:Uncharacterized protein n=1 Tax=Nyssa sinensis TaxID=561372 RepID=A0A5J5BWC1_9ASTE|nr:hypothetical protein F0562_002881 [Nyssa sinensis]
MEHHIDVEKGILPGSSGLNRVHQKILHNINEEIHHLPSLLPKACIFRVHHGLRHVNADAYTPMLVSIGPYHHGNPKLHAMEEHKLRYLHSLLERNNGNSAEHYLLFMQKLEDRARGFYAEPLVRDNFVKMMLLDACFIIEFLRKFQSEKLRHTDDPIFKSLWMQFQILRDMMLLENQLPFFVLSGLFDMTQIPNSHTALLELSMIPIKETLPAPLSLNSHLRVALGHKSVSESKHFLDLLHNVCRPSRRPTSSNESCSQIPCLTELHEAGVSFQVVKSSLLSCFDISFAQGHLKIPNFTVDDSTETLFRNIIAYEQHSSDVKPMCFTDYTYFMDKLINAKKDVTTLRLSGIMENWLGDDEEVACIFNKMGDGRIIDTETYYYSDLCEKLNKHYETSWNQAMAKLRRIDSQVMDHHIDIEEEILPGSSGLGRAYPKIVKGINAKIHGPYRYHLGNPKLQTMEEHKLRYLRSILQRNSEKSMERYIQVMEKLEDRARGFYAEPINLEREKFVEMMLLDACFIIEFLRKFNSKEQEDRDDPFIKSFWMDNQIFCDMMLLEN